ncbi:glycosyl hydrolase [Actinoplanes oblitus]|uniref:Glycosyl hydrolase n=1 Tax=Actinoplanes oblitus TaxID=3040509 RepID=A0ABY8WE30_9ACTN|nr:glycosyl hydrolase [Actinoplanes oblitus]WIM95642.1 glycosyl hydrolase [Actinoplanes oblitus]
MRLHRLTCATAALLLLLGGCSGDGERDAKRAAEPAVGAAPSPEPTGNALGSTTIPEVLPVAPYLDPASGTADAGDVAKATGQKDFTLAYVLARGAGDCTATWGGTKPLTDPAVAAQVARIEALGGRTVVATGGEAGTYLESTCRADQLTAAYASALDAAGANRLDVDIEQEVTIDTVAEALATLQKDRGTAITVTLPVAGVTEGLTGPGIALLKGIKAAGARVTVNALTMNLDAAGGGWGRAMTLAAGAVGDDLAAIWPDTGSAAIYRMLGVTPMIGVNNTGGTTAPDDAQYLLDWARHKGLGFVRFRSVNRDDGDCGNGTVAADCSGITQTKYQFTAEFRKFAS